MTTKRIFWLCALAGLTIGAVAAFVPIPYQAATILKTPPGETAQHVFAAAVQQSLSRNELAGAMLRLDLYQYERNRLPMEDILKRMQTAASITTLPDGTSYSIEVQSSYRPVTGSNPNDLIGFGNYLAKRLEQESQGQLTGPMLPRNGQRQIIQKGSVWLAPLLGLLLGGFSALRQRREVPA